MSSEVPVRYEVRMSMPNTHYFEVKITVAARGRSRMRFIMPVWTPGSYLVREFSKNVIEFSARDSSGTELRSSKDSKFGWTVETDGAIEVEVRYRVYAHELTVDTSYLDDLHGVINGASVFMYVEGMESLPIALVLILPAGWKAVSTGLQETERRLPGTRTYRAENFDILVDSPIELGNQDVYDFRVNSVKHEVSIFGLDRRFHERLVGDIRKIVENTIPVIGEIPYDRYVFIVDFTDDKGGGLEHLNSTHCMLPRLRLQPEEEYRRALTLFSHEFFHAWNVKRMRPVGLGPFDYKTEAYTRSLWVAEGVTSYYDNHILRRAGIFTVAEYLDMLSEDIDVLSSLPGSLVESAEEASFDTWIKYYRPDENSPNVVSSYYNQGAVIGWMLDMEIRRLSKSSRTLDDVMRKVYQDTFKLGRGYTDQEFESACSAVAGADLSQIFETRVRGREKIDFGKYLAYAGLKLVPKEKSQERPRGFLGVKIRTDSGKVLVTSRLAGSPAEDSGLSSGDEILGFNGMRLDGTTIPYFVSTSQPQTDVSIALARRGIIREVRCRLGTAPIFEYRVAKLDNADDEQKTLFSKWMGESWDNELKYPDSPPYPLRNQQFNYI